MSDGSIDCSECGVAYGIDKHAHWCSHTLGGRHPRMITQDDVSVSITPRRSAEGNPFSELLFVWQEGERTRVSCSRVNYLLDNTHFSQAHQIAEFVKRRNRGTQ